MDDSAAIVITTKIQRTFPVEKASLKSFLAVVSVFLATFASANEKNLKVSAESEVLYFKALPYLEKIDEVQNDMFTFRKQLAVNEKVPDQKNEQYREEMLLLVKEGMPLLKRSAEEGNPAAQYRLALMLSTFESRDQVAEKVCTLLKSSFSNGFTPAGLQMLFYCFDEVKTPGYRSLVDALPNDETLYSRYYPQPTMMPSCDRNSRSDSNPIVLLDEKSFRANLYMSMATQMLTQNLKQEQVQFLNKAAEHGCVRAIERLKLSSATNGAHPKLGTHD
ncbi:hypothetical protein HUT24_17880 [Pseudomonas protegens]|nr:hypothetical protein [Pseudomonas protegens]MBP5099713.1 hypothetical protein [Pseudomonas protegens]MBP5119638.1 hypothetical protein [Pseudomonas protegens]MBP5126957.1 hypothetical protein [Pseudomonas protegens]QTU06752.1 hypothetical protein HUT25_13735 [Pseudomonas protegens]QTU13062.1 hypothetical protein HUT23_14425 [Pseudomonas protegens]